MIKKFAKIFHINPTQVVVLSFVITIFIGSILLSLPFAVKDGQSTTYINSLFTSTSAVCVTGLVVVDTFANWSLFGQIIILLLIQIGGLGFMTMATMFSFVLRRKINLKERLIIAEALNQYHIQGIVKLVKKILAFTLIFEASGALLLSLRFVPEFGLVKGIYLGIFHAVSAFCNAGFDLMGRQAAFSSFTNYSGDIVINFVLITLIFIGGIGFAVLDDIYKVRSIKRLNLHSKLVLSTTFALIVFGFVFYFFTEYTNPATLGSLDFKTKLIAAMFQSVTPRTAGFNTIDIASLREASIFITIFLMFIGGSPGSTAGGIKTSTFGALIFTVFSVIKRRNCTELFKRRIDYATSFRALAITVLSLFVIIVGTIILLSFENISLSQAMFEATSAFGTVGLSLGITPYLSIIGKITLIIIMVLGRVGVLTMALALAASPKDINYNYPEDKVMVG